MDYKISDSTKEETLVEQSNLSHSLFLKSIPLMNPILINRIEKYCSGIFVEVDNINEQIFNIKKNFPSYWKILCPCTLLNMFFLFLIFYFSKGFSIFIILFQILCGIYYYYMIKDIYMKHYTTELFKYKSKEKKQNKPEKINKLQEEPQEKIILEQTGTINLAS